MPHTTHAALAVALLAVTGAGGLAMVGSQPSQALTISGLDVSDADHTLGPSESVDDVRLTTDLEYEYASTHAPDTVTLELFAAQTGGSFTKVDSQTLSDPALNDSGATTLSGGLVAAGVFPAGTFDVQEGATQTETVDVKVVMKLSRGGERIGLADAGTSADIVVSKEEMTVSASIAGSGSIQVQEG